MERESAESYADYEALFDFCRSHERIFLYGAGDYAENYTLLLHNNQVDVSGYIVSSRSAAMFCDRPVFTAEEIQSRLTARDGIIPAFEGATARIITENLGLRQENVFSLDHRKMHDCVLTTVLSGVLCDYEPERTEPCATLAEKQVESVLVVRIDYIGDMICTTALLRELRRNYPDATVTLVSNRVNAPLLSGCPYIDEVLFYDRYARTGHIAQQYSNRAELKRRVETFIRSELNGRTFDVLFMARELLYGASALEELFLAFSISSRYRIAYVTHDRSSISPECKLNLLKPYFSSVTLAPKICKACEQPLYTLRACGLSVIDARMELWLDDNVVQHAEKLLQNSKFHPIRIAIGIKGSAKNRCWNIENYCELFTQLSQEYGEHLELVILGGHDAQADASRLASMDHVVSFAGSLALDETAAVMSQCDLYIGPSTSLLHMATALGIPSVTLYHILDEPSEAFDVDGPPKWAPNDDLPHISLLPPPGLDGCRGYCRKHYAHCINLITPEQVCAAARKILSL